MQPGLPREFFEWPSAHTRERTAQMADVGTSTTPGHSHTDTGTYDCTRLQKLAGGRTRPVRWGVWATLVACISMTAPVSAQTFTVTNTNASGDGSLSQAITDANAHNGAATINITNGLGTITLTGELPILKNTSGITINGNNNVFDGGSTSNSTGFRAFFFGVGSGEAAVSPGLTATTNTAWSINNLTIQNANARGGNGGAGGGGGAGLGGGIFVNAGTLNLSGVIFSNNRAVGGNGASGQLGGGGGMGGHGGNDLGGGGGGFGIGADGGPRGTTGSGGNFLGGAAGGSVSSGGAGGLNGGGGGGYSTTVGGSGGGGGGVGGFTGGFTGLNQNGGNGGFGGGGGGLSDKRTGGYGGGGGSDGYSGGIGGFGGGGASGSFAGGDAGFGGGNGATQLAGTGGGGLGAGAAVFVRQGASINITDGSFSGGTVAGGTGFQNGEGLGSALFLAGSLKYTVSSGTVTISDTLGGSANASLVTGGLTKDGAGTLVLTGANTFSGGITINGGTLAVNSGSALGQGTNTMTFSDGTLRTDGPMVRSHDFVVATGKVAFIDTNGNDMTIYGVVSGNGGFIKTGAGVLTLNNSNNTNSQANNRIDGGVLEINHNAQLGNAAGTLFFLGGTLRTTAGTTSSRPVDLLSTGTFNTNGFDSTWGGAFTNTGSFTKAGNGTLTLTGTNTYSGGTTVSGGTLQIGSGGTGGVLPGNVTNNAALAFNRSDAVTYAGNISGTGTVTKAGAGTLTLSGTNTYSGSTTASAGTLQFAKSASLYNGVMANWTAANLTVQSGATAAFNVGGTGEFDATMIQALQVLGNGTGGFLTGSTLALDTTNAAGGTFAYGTAITNPAVGALALAKTGTGTLTLSGASTYTGATTIAQGTLALSGNGSFANSPTITNNGTLDVSNLTGGANFSGGGFVLAAGQTLKGTGNLVGNVTVPSGGTLGGSGTVGTVTVQAGGTVSPGNSPGTLTATGNTTIAGVYAFELGTAGTSNVASNSGGSSPALPHTNHDVLKVTGGSLTLTGSTLNLTALTGTGFDNTKTYSWTIATATGGIVGTPTIGTVSGADFVGLPGSTFTSSISLDGNSLNLNYAPVPEPTTVLALAAAGLGLARFRRRRVRS